VNDGELTGHGNEPQPQTPTALRPSRAAAAPPQPPERQAPPSRPRALQADRL